MPARAFVPGHVPAAEPAASASVAVPESTCDARARARDLLMVSAARQRRAESDLAMNKKPQTRTDRPAPRPLFIEELGAAKGGFRAPKPTTTCFDSERGGPTE